MARFTPGELNVMQLLWKHGEMKPGDIQDLYPGEIKNAALRSYLTILLDKGHVSRRKVGKAFFYKAVTRQKSAMRSTLKQLVDNYCGGSTTELLMSLIRSEKLSEEDLVDLRRLADGGEKDKTSSRSNKRRKKS
ncbi:MAG: BlaI/MecI/CopY family transcriptional regulator [Planctomycetota bacterium]